MTAGFFERTEKDIYTSVRYNFFDSSILDYKRHITDLGGGYFIPLNKGKPFCLTSTVDRVLENFRLPTMVLTNRVLVMKGFIRAVLQNGSYNHL